MIQRDALGGTEQRSRRHVGTRGQREEKRQWVGLIISAVAAAVSTYAASESAAQQREYQAQIEERKADAAKQAARIAADNQREQDDRLRAAQRARIGASGVSGDIGSPLLAEMDSAETAELNERRILYSGDVQAQGYKAEAVGQRFAASEARRLGYLGAGTALLTGGAKAYAGYGSSVNTGGDAGYSTASGYQSYRAGERDRSPYRY